ncbi:MAG: tetratricopeptide repeat protein [Chlamydiia bacterium]|nr:tetratricopeptide repeat protein [Chlamydiia bacterium]
MPFESFILPRGSLSRGLLTLLIVSFLATGCNRCPPPFEPMICYSPPLQQIKSLPTPFPPLKKEELQSLWGKELYLGTRFVEEGDWYRAITAFKSSYFLMPKRESKRREQVEFYLFLSYYFASKYKEAVETYEDSDTLCFVTQDFPAFKELKIALWESYSKICRFEKADLTLSELPEELQSELTVSEAIRTGDMCLLNEYALEEPVNALLWDFKDCMKSPKKAEFLQAALPGAGYLYVGQSKAALTSFIINALFIAAGIEFWQRGYYAASLITFSLETGWYFGGINGAGLAAAEYNERLYENLGKETLICNKMFPIFKFDVAF